MSDVTVRLAGAEDGAVVAAIYAPFVTDTAVTFEVDPPSADEMAERIGVTLPRWPWLIAELGGDPVGFAYAGLHRSRPAYRWSVEVSVYVSSTSHRRGVGRRLYGVLLELLADQGYRQAFAGITLPNEASVQLHRAVGFRPVGTYRAVGHKFGAWRDVAWWQRPLTDDHGEPGELRTLDELGPASVAAALG